MLRKPVLCLLWTWFDAILTTADLLIMAFISIERYLFVFHHGLVRRYKRLLCGAPIALSFVIPIGWYTSLLFGYPCENHFSYRTVQCGTPCYLTHSQVFVNVENFAFFIFPMIVVVLANSSLIASVLIQKASMKRQHRLNVWRNNLRMISQLSFIAILYMSVYVPSCVLLIFGSYVRRSRFQPWAANVRTRYFTHLKYLLIFGCPFVILAGQSEMHQPLKRIIDRIRPPYRPRWRRQTFPLTSVPTRIQVTLPS